jgi:ribosome modulation factor
MNMRLTTVLPDPSRPEPDTDFLHLTYRADLHLLVARWQRPVSDAEFRQGYQATLRAAQQAGCPFWQLDIRSRQAPEPATVQWLLTEFLPQVPASLGSVVCLAYLLRPTHLAELPFAPPIGVDVRTAFFAEEGPLTNWLSQCQHRSLAELDRVGFRPPPAA